VEVPLALSPESLPAGTLMVIDGTAILFRSFFGPVRLQSRDGTEVGAVMLLAQRLIRILRTWRTRQVAVVFDAGPRTFRNDLDPTYKANRGAPPPELVPQFDLAPRVVQALGIPTFSVLGFEADDLCATLARRAREQGLPAVLASTDKDLAQLVCDRPPSTWQLDPYKDRLSDESGIREKLGVQPRQVVDFMALVGDGVDNVPGVAGVGTKTAKALIGHFDALDSLYDRLDEVAGLPIRGAKTLGAKLEAGQADAARSRELVRLRDDVTLPGVEALSPLTLWHGPGPQADALFGDLGFHRPLHSARELAAELAEATPHR
jgi:DNA polymerase-1